MIESPTHDGMTHRQSWTADLEAWSELRIRLRNYSLLDARLSYGWSWEKERQKSRILLQSHIIPVLIIGR